MTEVQNLSYDALLKIKPEYGFWFIDFINADTISGVGNWVDGYKSHPSYWNVVEEFGKEPDVLDLVDVFYSDNLWERQPFKFILFWYAIILDIADVFYKFHVRCDNLSARLLKCHVYELPWYS